MGRNYAILENNDFMICMTEQPWRQSADKDDDKDTHRIYHFGLRISDISTWREIVKSQGLQLYYGGEVQYPHSKSWYIHDPSGHEIEVSYAEGGRLQFN